MPQNATPEKGADPGRGPVAVALAIPAVVALVAYRHVLGYTLIGCESTGLNAVLVRNDAVAGHFQALSAKEAFYREVRRKQVASQDEQFASLRDLPFEQG